MVVWLVLAALVAFAGYVRLAPSDPAVWHVAPTEAGESLPAAIGTAPEIVTTLNSALARLQVQGPPSLGLERLDAIAMATPRTLRLAGTPQEGRITWVTRSAILGFPDYTTAEATATDGTTSELVIHARSRFGRGDMGVNAARLRDWLSKL